MLNCSDVADFLNYSAHLPEYNISDLTHLKIQKLLYYSQAWNLVFRDRPLFREEIEAWVHGPVVPCVYQRYKDFGGSVIRKKHLFPNEINSEDNNIIEKVLRVYGKKSGKFLEHLTHSELPWKLSREGLSPMQRSQRVIPLDLMKAYYSKFNRSDDIENAMALALKITPRESVSTVNKKISQGIGSTLNIFPDERIDSFSMYTIEDFSTGISRAESLDSIWEQTGSYYYTAMNSIEKEIE